MSQKSASVRTTAGVITAGKTALSKKWSFLGVFLIVLLVTTSTAAYFDVLPNAQAATPAKATSLVASPIVAVATPELPTKIDIASIGLSVTVSNPTSTNVAVLDNALLTGAVRYPTSSQLGENGNVIIFGHSSYLPIVNNKAYKAFDGIQKLSKGDRITVTGSGHTYVYSVDTVVKASTSDSIPLTVSAATLTLATCNSFGDHNDRFVVTATLVETNSL